MPGCGAVPEWGPDAQHRLRVIQQMPWGQRMSNAAHERLLLASRDEHERRRQAHRRKAQRYFERGYDAAMHQVERDRRLTNIAYQQGHHDGKRNARRQIDERPFDGPGGFSNHDRGSLYRDPRSSLAYGRGGHQLPPPNHIAPQPALPPHQDHPEHGFHGDKRGGFRAPMPVSPRGPSDHARRIDYEHYERYQEVHRRRQH